MSNSRNRGSSCWGRVSTDFCSLRLLTFICVDSLQVHDVADDVVLVSDAVSSQHVSGLPGDVQGFTAAVPLQHGYHLWGGSVEKTPGSRCVKPKKKKKQKARGKEWPSGFAGWAGSPT